MERKVGECFQWKAIGQCSKGDSCGFSHDPASKRRHRLTEQKPIEMFWFQMRKSFWNKRPKSVHKFYSKESVRIRRVIIGVLPCVKIYMSESGCKYGDCCHFRHTETDGQPSNRRRKVV